ncbi:MAG: hypothetical protein AMJ43_08010, partial [Coxiella sp. DG_40]
MTNWNNPDFNPQSLTSDGIVVNDLNNGMLVRSLASGDTLVSITNADGTAGNPTISLTSDV